MIYGIGNDIVDNSRIKNLLCKFGDKFAKRILSDSEFMQYVNHNDRYRFVAKRFAAKEAFAKACGVGLRAPITMRGISVVNDSYGKPNFCFNIAISAWLKEHLVARCLLSISDEVNLSSAFVVLETI